MEVTIVDSEPSVVALVDYLDHLATQPPSLYLDIEGVKLSRHGSISILQLFVFPKNHVFLIDIFILQEKAFCTSNRSGIDLRSILESAQVPKVFFDVRNDSDALFAHFQISMQGIHDVQLLEVATRSYPKERLSGLARCIEKDTQLTVEASGAWKATKKKGLLYLVPERGGSYEVFNVRPMLQDIIHYCTQDVVYLPVLWKMFTRKISTKWMRKVQDATSERVRESQTASYEPHGKNKSRSPWAKSAKSGGGNRPDGPSDTGARDPGRKTMTTVAQKAVTEAAKKTAATQPDAKPHSQRSVGEPGLRRSARLAALKATSTAPEITAELEPPLSKIDLPSRSKNELEGESHRRTGPTLYPDTVHSKWTCITCGRKMQEHQKEYHLAGKQHIARVKRTAPRPNGTAKQKTLGATTVTKRNPQTESFPIEAKPRQKNPAAGTNGRRRQAAVPGIRQIGMPYPPDHLFSGFEGCVVPDDRRYGNRQYETSLEDVNHALCDKDCGWCGHCMDGVDVWSCETSSAHSSGEAFRW